METLLAQELASEKMKYTLELKDKKVKETELEAKAEKTRREIGAEAAGREQVIAAKAQEEAMKQLERLRSTAESRLLAGPDPALGRVWLPVLMRLEPSAGLDLLERTLQPLPIESRGAAVSWLSSLLGNERDDLHIDLAQTAFSSSELLRLTRLVYRHVRPQDDARHGGAYSPDERDHAERGRGNILEALLRAKGPAAWQDKLQLAAEASVGDLRDRVVAIALERSAEEMDAAPSMRARSLRLIEITTSAR